jgi:hypothetical protein
MNAKIVKIANIQIKSNIIGTKNKIVDNIRILQYAGISDVPRFSFYTCREPCFYIGKRNNPYGNLLCKEHPNMLL